MRQYLVFDKRDTAEHGGLSLFAIERARSDSPNGPNVTLPDLAPY